MFGCLSRTFVQLKRREPIASFSRSRRVQVTRTGTTFIAFPAHMEHITLLACFATTLGSDCNALCNNEVIQCIKNINNGSFPINPLTSVQVLWNRDYSIVWYSRRLVEQQQLTCVTTKFGLKGSKDTYYHGCTSTEQIDFKTSYNIRDHTFTISDYQGMTLKAYAVYKKHCLALYVCSPEGVTKSHITLYCPSSKLKEVKSEIEEAKAKFSSCGINDGTTLCDHECT